MIGSKDTKNRIMLASLKLFAKSGYKAVSVSDIASELGITKGALYKHYESKRDILNGILHEMERRDAEQAIEFEMPDKDFCEMEEAYRRVCVDDMIEFSRSMFAYWTQNEFAADFRKMLTIAQFEDPEMAKLYQQYLVSGPLGYMTDLFAAMGIDEPREEAVRFYAPMFLLYAVYDAAEDKAPAVRLLNGLMDDARRRIDTLRKEKAMNNKDVVIRRETRADRRAVEELVRESFWNVYRPGCYEHFVIHRLRGDRAFVPELDLVMEKDGRLIGQNMFMHAEIRADDGRSIPIMTMGPICIAPELKRQGYGKLLLDRSLELAAELGCGALCFEGNIGFYGKSGFTYARSFGIRYHGLPEGADDSFFLCKELIPGYLSGVSGEYAPPEGYYCAERYPELFEAFDSTFPKKEKLKLPGQLFD